MQMQMQMQRQEREPGVIRRRVSKERCANNAKL
jgi:hypothetical protein